MAATVSKKGKTVVSEAVVMLKEMKHRGSDAHGVATPDSVIVTKSVEEIIHEKVDSSVALGHNLSKFLSRDRPQPVQLCLRKPLIPSGAVIP